jgi:hypothetical protein
MKLPSDFPPLSWGGSDGRQREKRRTDMENWSFDKNYTNDRNDLDWVDAMNSIASMNADQVREAYCQLNSWHGRTDKERRARMSVVSRLFGRATDLKIGLES